MKEMEEKHSDGVISTSTVEVEEVGYTVGVCASIAALVYGIVKLCSTSK